MYLKEGCSLLFKVRKPLVPFLLNQKSPLPILKNPEKDRLTNLQEHQVVKKLKQENDITLALSYFKSISNSNSFKPTPFTYKIMVQKLGQCGDLDGIQYLLQQMKLEGVCCSEDLFVEIISCYKKLGLAEQALKMFYRLQDFNCKPTVKIYNHVLDALLAEDRFQMINPIYSNMKKDGVEPNVFTYNVLLKALCKNGRIDAACKLLEEMSNKGCWPDDVSYTTIVSSLCKDGKVKEARKLASTFAPIVPIYNALISGYCQDEDFGEVFALLNEMLRRGIDPNVITYTIVINSLCDVGNANLSMAVLGRCLLEDAIPTFIHLLP
uniref:Uncharacterized protein n=1 Tax=Opuntia streptacantha TaxID=393608 RepID=A0A7C9AH15_OPUST